MGVPYIKRAFQGFPCVKLTGLKIVFKKEFSFITTTCGVKNFFARIKLVLKSLNFIVIAREHSDRGNPLE